MTTRRKFINNLAFLVLPSTTLGLTTPANAQPNNLFVLSGSQNRLAKRFLRPLADGGTGSRNFPRDTDLLKRMQRWLRTAMLAQNRVHIEIDADKAFQLANVRPDCNGYVVHITDTELLAQIISQGKRKTPRAAHLLSRLPAHDICWGNLYWLRQIKKHGEGVSRAGIKPNADVIEEIYWLDVIYRVNGIAIPAIRVFYNSIGVVTFSGVKYTPASLTHSLSRTPYFVNSNTMLMTWHELADRLQLQNNLYYLRACFGSAGLDKDVIAVRPGPLSARRVVVFRRDGQYDRIQDAAPPPFNSNGPYAEQATPYATMTLRQLEQVDLTNVSSSFFEELSYIHHDAAEPPKPVAFPEAAAAGREFIYFVSNQFGVRYEGDGYFSVSFAMTEPSSATGVRGSGWVAAVGVVIADAGAGAVLGVGVAAGGAGIALGHAIKSMRESDPERQRLRKQIIATSQVCATISATEAECHECAELTGNLEAERKNLGADLAITILTELGTAAAVGCGGGALIGFFGGAVLAVPGCGIGAITGLVLAGGAAILDYLAYEDAVNKLESEAFAPCDTVEMRF